MFRRFAKTRPSPPLLQGFGIRSAAQVARDLGTVVRHLPGRKRFTFDLASSGLLRPDLSLPAYAGLIPKDGISPIFNFFDRTAGGSDFRFTVTRASQRDWRGGRLSYDEHDGTDFVCPPGTPLAAAAPGVLVAVRDTWLRGGLTACVDHGEGVLTQYTHLSEVIAQVGQPLRRGEVVALSGNSGFDMTQFFPWVPPHVHFMVWVNGRPVDPFLAEGEAPRAGIWAHGNEPRAAKVDQPLEGDATPESARSRFDEAALERLIDCCSDPLLRAELESAPSAMARLAICEDALHHQRLAWPDSALGTVLRAQGDARRVRLTLPLSSELYRGAAPADTRWTRP